MIANCDVLITRYSSTVYVGMVLGKEVYSDFEIDELRKLVPLQNGGTSAFRISLVAKALLLENSTAAQKDLLNNRISLKLIPERIRKS
jgi:hypothetical protein